MFFYGAVVAGGFRRLRPLQAIGYRRRAILIRSFKSVSLIGQRRSLLAGVLCADDAQWHQRFAVHQWVRSRCELIVSQFLIGCGVWIVC